MIRLKNLAFLIILTFLSTQSFAITYTWNGGTGFWNNSNNWSPAGLPTYNDSVEIPFGTVIIPHGYDAYAYTVTVYTAGNLINRRNGELFLGGSISSQMDIHGSVTNRGKIHSNPQNGSPDRCMFITGSFTQTSTGKTYIDDFLVHGIYNFGTFNNAGTIDIDGGFYGGVGIQVESNGSFINQSAGWVFIDDVTNTGFAHVTNTPHENHGRMYIRSSAMINGLTTLFSDFNNYNYIFINGGSFAGMNIQIPTTLTNSGEINVASTNNAGVGILALGSVENTGVMKAQNSGDTGIEIGWNGHFTNLGEVLIFGDMGGTPLLVLNILDNEGSISVTAESTGSPYQIDVYGSVENQACGYIFHDERLVIQSSGYILNEGYWTSFNDGNDTNLGFIENVGVIAHPYGGFDNISLTNYGYLLAPIPGVHCQNQTIYDAFTVGSNPNHTILDGYTDGKNYILAATYHATSNKLIPTIDAVGLDLIWMEIERSGCSYLMPVGFENPIESGGCFAPETTPRELGQIQYKTELEIFPNPSSGPLNIRISENEIIQNIQIRDLAGRLIWNGLDTKQIPEIPAGVYTIQVQTQSTTLPTQKWVKQ